MWATLDVYEISAMRRRRSNAQIGNERIIGLFYQTDIYPNSDNARKTSSNTIITAVCLDSASGSSDLLKATATSKESFTHLCASELTAKEVVNRIALISDKELRSKLARVFHRTLPRSPMTVWHDALTCPLTKSCLQTLMIPRAMRPSMSTRFRMKEAQIVWNSTMLNVFYVGRTTNTISMWPNTTVLDPFVAFFSSHLIRRRILSSLISLYWLFYEVFSQ